MANNLCTIGFDGTELKKQIDELRELFNGTPDDLIKLFDSLKSDFILGDLEVADRTGEITNFVLRPKLGLSFKRLITALRAGDPIDNIHDAS